MGKRLYGTCELCQRDDLELTVHHLIPKELGGTFEPTADLCIACHKQIHALYTNQELAVRLHTIAALQADEKISSFLKWIRKQPSSKLVKTKKSNERKQKGR
ncbi:HNH endonuclease [Ectobacillus antri]|jgi:5-methylcytosine-specific restriction protein A|uniref:HNH endonuclease n=1 Tax=Ectobacillus antri TaxID=2486280 RepID=A0ABT6H656_9BACI|nr:HNH endonuclease [Ectobacillus antri]MDG4656711.1 HNH endonuclease [Ectobacillus antri]MDG5753926.1 HNH endonuclease [Ectobacillus antri]